MRYWILLTLLLTALSAPAQELVIQKTDGTLLTSQVRSATAKFASPPAQDAYQVFFGDIHNHNDIGYAKGSLQRAFDIARSHLDFFALTPNAQWHDMPLMEGDR